MNEVTAITIWFVALATIIVVTVIWFSKEYRDDGYLLRDKDRVFDDFYTLEKRKKDV